MKNILFIGNICPIGGIETMLYMLAKKYHDWDITVYYKTGDYKQILRLANYVRVRQYRQGERLKCEKIFFNYNIDIIDYVDAKEYIQVVHCDFVEAMKSGYPSPNTHPKITKYLAVSEVASKSFEKLTGIRPEVCYNPLMVDEPKKVLHLITASRLTREKGKHRMVALANALDKANIPYIWTVFTNDTNAIDNPNVVYMKPRLDITNYIADADYLVQLSDTEAYSYSICEALSLGTPIIVTPLPVLEEMGANESNSIVVDFGMQNIPIDKIYQGLPSFKYKPKEDVWDKLLIKGKTTYKKENIEEEIVTIKPIKRYFDIQLNKIISTTDKPFQVTRDRAENLIALGLVTIIN